MLKIQRYLYYLLFFVTPFIMLSITSELFEFNKLIYIYITASLLLCVWIARMVTEKKFLFKRTPFDLFIAFFFISQVISTVFSIDVHTSLFGYYGRFNGGLLSLIAYLIIYYSIAEFFHAIDDKKEFIYGLLHISVIASTLVILWGLPGKVGYDLSCLVFSGKLNNACWTAQFDPAARMFSTLGQPNWLGAYLDITYFIVLYLFFRSSVKTDKVKFYAFGAASLLQLLGIFFTSSRSSVVAAVVVTVLVYAWVFLKRKSLHLADFRLKLIPLIFAVVFSFLFFRVGTALVARMFPPPPSHLQVSAPSVQPAAATAAAAVEAPKVTESLDIRKIVWKGAVELGMQYPLFGTGVETFAYSYYFVRPQAHNLTSEWDYLYNKAHNEYLNYFATTGFLGIGTYLLFLGAVAVLTFLWTKSYTWKEDNDAEYGLLQVMLFGGWVTILLTNAVGFSTTVISLYFFLIPVLLYLLQVLKKPADGKHPVSGGHRPLSGSAALIGYGSSFILAIFFVQYFVSYWLADTKFAMAENLARTNDYQNAVLLLNQAMQLRPDHVYEDKLSYDLANLAFIASYQKNAQLSNELMQASIKYNTQSLLESPQNIIYYKTKVKDLYVFYQITLDRRYIEEGIKALNESVKISPTDPKLPFFLATYYSVLYDEEKNPQTKKLYMVTSLEQAEKSIQLKSDYFESHYLKAQLYRKYGNTAKARTEYEYILQYLSPGNKQIETELKTLKP